MARLSDHLQRAVENLPAPSFSFVMATGIVSISLLMHGLVTFSWVLLGVAAAGYVILIGLTIAQIVRHPDTVRGFLRAPQTRFAYFTFVAGSDVLGSRLILADVHAIPIVQLLVALMAWIFIAVLVVRALRADPSSWRNEVDGSWFLASVAANSIGVLAGSIAKVRPAFADPAAILSLLAWAIGIGCYLVILFGVASRLWRRQLTAESLTSPYWITMGACAIAVLNSSRILNLPVTESFAPVTQFIGHIGLAIWVLATVLIPFILAVGWWRHMHHRVPLDNTVLLWSVVFPLGMYDVASTLVAQDYDQPVASVIGSVGVYLALAAWVLTIAWHVWRRLRRVSTPREA